MVAHGLRIAMALIYCASLCAISAALASAPAQAQQSLPLTPCASSPLGTATIVSIRDGRTLVAEDGREIRLAGLATPAAEPAAKAALEALAAGQTLRLEKMGADSDRYGRVLAWPLRALPALRCRKPFWRMALPA
jgi:endonuclease YncB( thermonuclease family)